jgi:signal transduction histidine kinase
MNLKTKETVFQRFNNFFTRDARWVSLVILIGLTLLYSAFYPVLTATFGEGIIYWIVGPVILAAWVYGLRGGLIASLVGVLLSMALAYPEMSPDNANLWVSRHLWGSFFLVIMSIMVGYSQDTVKKYVVIEQKLRERGIYLALLNQMTQTILAGHELNTTLQALADTIAQLFKADGCYITRWDAMQELVIPVVTSAKLDKPYSQMTATKGEKNMTTSALEAGHTLFADDIFNSPYINPEVARQFPAVSALSVPLIVNQHKLGAIIIAFDKPHKFTSEEVELAEQTGTQIALALWNVEQEEKIGQQLKETNTLVKIGRALSKTERTGTSTVLQLIVDSARELIPRAEQSVIHLLDQEESVLIPYAASGFADNYTGKTGIKMPLGTGVAGQVIQHGEAINIPDVRNDPRFLSATPTPFRSLMVAPIQSGDEQIGTISVQSDSIHAFSSDEVELLKALGAQAAIAIENTQLYETTEKRLKEMDVLYHISRQMGISFDPSLLLTEVVKLLKEKFGYYNVQLFMLNRSDNKIDFHSSDQNQVQLPEIYERLDATASIVGHVAGSGESFITNNLDQVLFFQQDVTHPNIQSELAVPIKIEGQVMGVLDIQHTPPNKLEESDLRLVTAIANQLAINMHEASLYSNLQESLKQEKEMRSQLIQSERLALVGRLLASVSHELNNPLQAIQNALFLIKDEIGLSSQGRQDMDIILSETDRMATLIERLRVVYKPVREQDFQILQINDLVQDISILISAHMRRKEISFDFHPAPGLPTIAGIPDQLIQVLLNIFLNAVEAMPLQGKLFVKTEIVPGEDEIMITIKDTGPGIDPELLPNIFNPFVTTKDSGTGLGLAISHDIVQQHAGHIEATNDPQGGAIFTIWLPIRQKEYS